MPRVLTMGRGQTIFRFNIQATPTTFWAPGRPGGTRTGGLCKYLWPTYIALIGLGGPTVITVPQKGTKPKNKTGPPNGLWKTDRMEAAKTLVGTVSTAIVTNTIANLIV